MFEVHISKQSLFRLKITVGCRLCTCPSIHPSLDEDTLKITVGCGGVWWWCVVVVCGGGVLWWCVVVVKLGTHSLSLVLSPSSSLSLYFSLFSFFFSLLFLFLFLLLLLLLLVLLLFFLFLFFLLASLLLTLLFSSLHANTVQSTDQQTRRPTLRRLNVMWPHARRPSIVDTDKNKSANSGIRAPDERKKKRGDFFYGNTGCFATLGVFIL